MKREKIELSPERSLVFNLIQNTEFLKAVHSLVDSKYFETQQSQIIVKWVLEYFSHYGEAPGKNIYDIYEQKRKAIPKEEIHKAILDLLDSLKASYSKYEITNMPHSIHMAIKFFNLRALTILYKNLENAIAMGQIEEGQNLVAKYAVIDKPRIDGTFLFMNSPEIMKALTKEYFNLFKLPGVLGQAIGTFARENLYSFAGPSGRGKTWWLLYVAFIAVAAGLRVVFFELEMPQEEIIQRAWSCFLGRPYESEVYDFPFFVQDGDKKIVDFEERTSELLDPDLEVIEKKQEKFRRLFRRGDISFQTFPMNTLTNSKLDTVLDNLEFYENFVADVVIVDHADNMLPESLSKNSDHRHGINYIWQNLKRTAQDRACAVFTATHTAKHTHGKDIEEKDVSEDSRKLAHVSTMIAINQTKEEEERNIQRLSLLKRRGKKVHFSDIIVLGCRDIGRACVDSELETNVEL